MSVWEIPVLENCIGYFSVVQKCTTALCSVQELVVNVFACFVGTSRNVLDKPAVQSDSDGPGRRRRREHGNSADCTDAEGEKKEAKGRPRHADHWICSLQG